MCNSNNCLVDINFIENLSQEELLNKVNQLTNPQIIIWYIGCYGLKEVGVKFYKNFLLSPILNNDTNATFWLVDLTAWGAFKTPQGSIHKFNSCCEKIDGFSNKQIKHIKSSDIFKEIQEINDHKIINYFKTSLKKNFISEPSERFQDINITIKDIFSNNCQIVSDWYNEDVSKTYSLLQYLEGCLLIKKIFLQQTINHGDSEVEIVFALPNDETKYYKDEEHSFQKDLTFLISKTCENLNLKNTKLKINFLSFRYGSHLHERPYNAPGKTLKSKTLSYEDIVNLSTAGCCL